MIIKNKRITKNNVHNLKCRKCQVDRCRHFLQCADLSHLDFPMSKVIEMRCVAKIAMAIVERYGVHRINRKKKT